jgi:hypothetical protein
MYGVCGSISTQPAVRERSRLRSWRTHLVVESKFIQGKSAVLFRAILARTYHSNKPLRGWRSSQPVGWRLGTLGVPANAAGYAKQVYSGCESRSLQTHIGESREVSLDPHSAGCSWSGEIITSQRTSANITCIFPAKQRSLSATGPHLRPRCSRGGKYEDSGLLYREVRSPAVCRSPSIYATRPI